MHRHMSSILFLSAALLVGCAGITQQPAASIPPQSAVPSNDFPTQTRVEYVLNCMQEHGGRNYDNLYHCVCEIDKIAAEMPHEEFLQAQTFAANFNLAGERGGLFRDPPQSKKLRDRLKEAKEQAAACFPDTGKASSPKKN
ncbi:MAG: hypothetical protein PHE55_16160 [Methylococcaceae bacterium]|nr:hypothetical protein [Methylococcaceae bacterium]